MASNINSSTPINLNVGGSTPLALTSTGAIVTSMNGGQLAGMRNKIINGKMDIAQRGTSFPAIASGAYSLDRYYCVNVGSQVLTFTQQADTPSNNEFQNSLRIAVTTADSAIAAGDLSVVGQAIEGFNVRDLIGRTFTLSFWVRSSKIGTHCLSFHNGAGDRSYILEYNIAVANTWEFKSVTVNGGLITAGTWNWTNGSGLQVTWALAAGANWQTTASSWQAGNFRSTPNQVNCLDTVGNIFAITGVQLEVGSVATPFEHRDIGFETSLAQRYFNRIVTGNNGARYSSVGGTWHAMDIFWPTTMRTIPSNVSLSNLAYSNCSSATAPLVTASHATITVSTAGVATYSISTITIDASAEL